MKKNVFFLVTAVLVVFMVSCASSQSVSKATPSSYSFDGFWELPDGEIFFFEKKAFLLLAPDGDLGLNGIFNQTNTRIILDYYHDYQPMRAIINYSVLSNNEVKINQPDMLAGVWKRRNDLNNETANKLSTIPFLGYWERRPGNEINVMHITPWGWGFLYFNDLNYVMQGVQGGDVEYGTITYDLKSPINGLEIIIIKGDTKVQSRRIISYRTIINDNELLIGNGDDLSKYLRFIRVK